MEKGQRMQNKANKQDKAPPLKKHEVVGERGTQVTFCYVKCQSVP